MSNQFYFFSELLFTNQYGNISVFSINYGYIRVQWLNIRPANTEYDMIFAKLKNMES